MTGLLGIALIAIFILLLLKKRTARLFFSLFNGNVKALDMCVESRLFQNTQLFRIHQFLSAFPLWNCIRERQSSFLISPYFLKQLVKASFFYIWGTEKFTFLYDNLINHIILHKGDTHKKKYVHVTMVHSPQGLTYASKHYYKLLTMDRGVYIYHY